MHEVGKKYTIFILGLHDQQNIKHMFNVQFCSMWKYQQLLLTANSKHNILIYLDIDAVFSFAGSHTVSCVQQLSNIQVTFSVSEVNPCLDRPAIAEVTEVCLIHNGT